MITTFRNLEISNKLLDLNITDDVFKDAKKVFKNDVNHMVESNFYYYIFKPTYKIGIVLGKPGYSNGDDKVVKLEERDGKNNDNATWYQVNNARFNFVPTTEEILKINYLYSSLRMQSQKDHIYKSIGEFKTAVINQIRNEDKANNYTYCMIDTHISNSSEEVIELVNVVNWLYDTDFDTTGLTDKQLESLNSKHAKFDWELSLYYKVKDIADNRRLAIVAKVGDTYFRGGYNYRRNYGGGGYSSTSWKIIDVPHDNPAYNYIDEGTYASNFGQAIAGSIQFDGTVNSLPKSYEPIEHAIGRRKDLVHVFDQNAIDKANKKYMLKVAMDKNDEHKKEAVKLKINSRIKNIDKQPLKLNEAIFSENKIEYSGQILKSDKIKVQDVLTDLYRYHDLDDINYDRAFEMFITKLIKETMHTYNVDIDATIGDINVTLHQKTGMNKANNNYAVYYINKVRVNKDEFDPILQRAACFENATEYNKFLKQVSTCSLKIHGLLDRGIDISVRNPLKNEHIILKLELIRKNKRQHLKIGKETFLIKNTTRIVNLPKKEFLDDLIDVLLNPANVENITPTNLKTLVIQARQAYTDAIEKSKQLLETTIDKFNLERTTIDVKNSRHSGYIVPGKLKTYFVTYDHDSHTNGCGVYSYPDMNYLCIVDKTPNQQVGVDKFVNRIYALANDQLLAKQIHTLGIQK